MEKESEPGKETAIAMPASYITADTEYALTIFPQTSFITTGIAYHDDSN